MQRKQSRTHLIDGECFDVVWNGGHLLMERKDSSTARACMIEGCSISKHRQTHAFKRKSRLRGDFDWDRNYLKGMKE